MSNTNCLTGPAFSITGLTYFTVNEVDFALSFADPGDEASVKAYQWFLDNELIPGQITKTFLNKVPCGVHTIKSRILTADDWSGLKAVRFYACDVYPQFVFTDVTAAAPGVLIESNTITAPGKYTGYPISITEGEYQVNGGSWTSLSGTVDGGDLVKIRRLSSASLTGSVSAALTIGPVTDVWNIATREAMQIPVYYTVSQDQSPYVHGGYLMHVNGVEVARHGSTSQGTDHLITELDQVGIYTFHYTAFRWPIDGSLTVTIKDDTGMVIHTYTGGTIEVAEVDSFTFEATSPSYTIDVVTNSNDSSITAVGYTLQNDWTYPAGAIQLSVIDDYTGLTMLVGLSSIGPSEFMAGAFNVKKQGATLTVPFTNTTNEDIQVYLFNDYNIGSTFVVPANSTITRLNVPKGGIHMKLQEVQVAAVTGMWIADPDTSYCEQTIVEDTVIENFASPAFPFVAANNEIYFADASLNAVVRFDPLTITDGSQAQQISIGANTRPTGGYYHAPNNKYYVNSFNGGGLKVINCDINAVETTIPYGGNAPYSRGNVYYIEARNEIWALGNSGFLIADPVSNTKVVSSFNPGPAVFVSSFNGKIYVFKDGSNNNVTIFDKDLVELKTVAGLCGKKQNTGAYVARGYYLDRIRQKIYLGEISTRGGIIVFDLLTETITRVAIPLEGRSYGGPQVIDLHPLRNALYIGGSIYNDIAVDSQARLWVFDPDSMAITETISPSANVTINGLVFYPPNNSVYITSPGLAPEAAPNTGHTTDGVIFKFN